MRRLAGQVARISLWLLHHTLAVALAFIFFATLGLGVLAWRVGEEPLQMDWLVRRLQIEDRPVFGTLRLSIGKVSLAWNGWRLGLGQPLVIRVEDLRAVTPESTEIAVVPRAEIELSLFALVRGRIAPRAIILEEPAITLTRREDGSFAMGLAKEGAAQTGANTAQALLGAMAGPRGISPGSVPDDRWSALREVRIADGHAVIDDHALHTIWTVAKIKARLRHHRKGGADAFGEAELALKPGPLRAEFMLHVPPDTPQARLRVHLDPFSPPALAALSPKFASLAALDAPLSANAEISLRGLSGWEEITGTAEAGQGMVHVAGGIVPLVAARVTWNIQGKQLHIREWRAVLAATDGSAGPQLSGSGSLALGQDRLKATLNVDLDQVRFADLSRYWPEGAAKGARKWVTENITEGVARAGHVALEMEGAADGSDLTLTNASGRLQGDDLSVYWLRPLPPLQHVPAELTLLSPDALVVSVTGGVEAGGKAGGITLKSGSVRVEGMMTKDQVATLDLDLAGPIADAIDVLRHPRLHLFEHRSLRLSEPAGTVRAKISAMVPLEERVTMERIALHANGEIKDGHLSDIFAGQSLDQAMLNFDVDPAGMRIDGTAKLAEIPTRLAVRMDFAPGPPTQVLQEASLTATVETSALARFGLNLDAYAAGAASTKATLIERRSGEGSLSLTADLTPVRLAFPELGWEKSAGQSAHLAMRAQLEHEHLAAINPFELSGTGLRIAGWASFVESSPQQVNFTEIMLGQSKAKGELLFLPSHLLRASFSGPILDLSQRLSAKKLGMEEPRPSARRTGPAGAQPAPEQKKASEQRRWEANLAFQQVVFGPSRELTKARAFVSDNGAEIDRVEISAELGHNKQFTAAIAPIAQSTSRSITLRATDGGGLLHVFGLLHNIQNGELVLNGTIAGELPGHPLSARMQFDSFTVRDAPLAAKLLQAATLYGLIDLLRGPGLRFDQMVANFRLQEGLLTLEDSRAHSPALGFTAKGLINLNTERVDLNGTIVPAYALNRLPGEIPLIGRLFSPEKGGGLFAVNFRASGPLDDPSVSINPLSGLTPGFLRGLFDIFDNKSGSSGSGSTAPPSVSPSYPRPQSR
jgi:hypothetical protein